MTVTERRKREIRERGREIYPLIHWFTPQMTTRARADQTEVRTQELHLGFPHGYRAVYFWFTKHINRGLHQK